MKVLENSLNKPEKNTCVNTDRLSLSLHTNHNLAFILTVVLFGVSSYQGILRKFHVDQNAFHLPKC